MRLAVRWVDSDMVWIAVGVCRSVVVVGVAQYFCYLFIYTVTVIIAICVDSTAIWIIGRADVARIDFGDIVW
jgi:hypothetical protein